MHFSNSTKLEVLFAILLSVGVAGAGRWPTPEVMGAITAYDSVTVGKRPAPPPELKQLLSKNNQLHNLTGDTDRRVYPWLVLVG
ncbi:hypothetical protein NUW54_g9225 [Trametes sanguinea]|uniref:Uncharacterized protein n=1 Tax=Trametes sanguinea TaxID=158606 RepID=A0ACC1P7L2_9APHY|nr:hypothetical protein NUW54_g9225 [Trametes sanguinea]